MTEDDNVEWVAPVPGTWLRTFRLREWLPAPLTPLFETWLLDHLETACFKAMVTAGLRRFQGTPTLAGSSPDAKIAAIESIYLPSAEGGAYFEP